VTVGGTALALAAGAWAVADPVALRVVAAAAAVAACTGAVLLRRWDQSAGKQVADLKAARQRDEWRTDERIAELEVDLEDSRELRGRLENKLRAKRAELARLRTEHADLLRRYATAESERARTLEDRRQLALGAGSSAQATAKDAGASRCPVDADAFAKADRALLDLTRNGARQQAVRTVEEARRRDLEADKDERDERPGRHSAERRDLPALPVREQRAVSEVAAAVLPYAKPQRLGGASRAQGGFDFFGTSGDGAKKGAEASESSEPEPKDAPEDDIADVVGEEALAEHRASKVIDLTAHDETEQLDLRELRRTGSS
jgi:hypothetical protein